MVLGSRRFVMYRLVIRLVCSLCGLVGDGVVVIGLVEEGCVCVYLCG